MAEPGETLENPASGETVLFEATAADTGGAALRFQMTFRPSGFVAQEHLHPRQEELHEVLEGTLGLSMAGRERTLSAGESVLVPPATPHRLIDRGPVRARFEVRPALRQEVLLETFAGLARDGKLSKRGMPGLLQLAVIAREFEEEGYATRPPLGVQRVLFGALANLGRRRGLRGAYPQYSDPELARAKPPADSAPRVDSAGYVFIDEWDVDAPQQAVFDALSDQSTYPQWWRPVYIAVESEGRPRVGQVAHQHFKGRLPYQLKTTSRTTRLDPPRLIEAEVDGDLSGRGLWTLTPTEHGTHVCFDWRVDADRPLLRVLTPLLRPLFRANHNWAIARAMEGLEPFAKRAASSH